MQTRSTTIEQGTPTAASACPHLGDIGLTPFLLSGLPHEKERSLNWRDGRVISPVTPASSAPENSFDFLRAVVDTGLTTMMELVKSSFGITTEPHSLRSRLSPLGTDLCGKSKPQAIVRRRTSMFPTTEAPRSKKTRPALSPFGRVCHFQPTYNVSEHPCGTVDQMPILPIQHPLDRAGSGAEKKSEISRRKCDFLPSSLTRYGRIDVFQKGDSARSGGLTSRNERTLQSLWAFTAVTVKQVPRGSFTRFRKGSNGSTNRLSHLHG